jgi:hypothetical protein
MNATKIELIGWTCSPMDSTETCTPLDKPTGLMGAHLGVKTQMPDKYEGHDDTSIFNLSSTLCLL